MLLGTLKSGIIIAYLRAQLFKFDFYLLLACGGCAEAQVSMICA